MNKTLLGRRWLDGFTHRSLLAWRRIALGDQLGDPSTRGKRDRGQSEQRDEEGDDEDAVDGTGQGMAQRVADHNGALRNRADQTVY